MTKTCTNCMWVQEFIPRPDEVERGLTLGCNKPGWEGYTSNEKSSCDGVFFSPRWENSPLANIIGNEVRNTLGRRGLIQSPVEAIADVLDKVPELQTEKEVDEFLQESGYNPADVARETMELAKKLSKKGK